VARFLGSSRHHETSPTCKRTVQLGGDSFAAQAAQAPDDFLKTYLNRLGNREEIRGPLQTIIQEARRNVAPDELPPNVQEADRSPNSALGLGVMGWMRRRTRTAMSSTRKKPTKRAVMTARHLAVESTWAVSSVHCASSLAGP
jgi:hypothetical protein